MHRFYAVPVAIITALTIAVACGDDTNDNGDDPNGNDGNNEITVSEDEYVQSCTNFYTTCFSDIDPDTAESGCVDWYEFDTTETEDPAGCVEQRLEVHECIIDRDCHESSEAYNEAADECLQEIVGVGPGPCTADDPPPPEPS